MSNDLISRSALMEGRVENDPVRIAAMCAETAYDVDAVCEELENSGYYTQQTFDDDGYGNDDSEHVIDVLEAIETVRNGGKA